jgi:hypothetical protein
MRSGGIVKDAQVLEKTKMVLAKLKADETFGSTTGITQS